MPSTLRIEYSDHKQRQQVVTLNSVERDTWHIGRRDGGFMPEINLSWDYEVSRHHARIFYNFGAWFIEHLAYGNQTHVNDNRLALGVPLELPPDATIRVGKTTIQSTYRDAENMPEGHVTQSPAHTIDQHDEVISETQRIDVMACIAKLLAQPDQDLLEDLLDEIRRYFPAAASGGIAIYRDKEPYVPVFYPRGAAQISFTLARRALATQQVVQWDRTAASLDSQMITSLSGTVQALYVPIVRGAKKLAVIYLHTASQFSRNDIALLTAISETLGMNPQFQPESTHLRLPSVFVSYSHKDIDFVKKLVSDLRRQRVTVWFDERLRSGKDWEDQLVEAIWQSNAFALVMSPDSLKSEYVQWEIEQARTSNKPIFPLWHRHCDDVSTDLDRLQRIDLLADYQAGVRELVDELYELSGEEDRLQAKLVVVRSARKREKTRIMFLAANPLDTDPLRLGVEIRTIQERIRGGKYRDQFDMIQQGWAVRFSDLQQYLLEYKPHIVHFSGHGDQAGQLILENNTGESQPVNKKTLKLLFNALRDERNLAGGVQLVVLNACFSAIQAETIAEEVGCVLGMTRAVSDPAAIEFVGAFYNALTFAKSAQTAFNLAAAAMGLTGEEETPHLLTMGVKATELLFCQEDDS